MNPDTVAIILTIGISVILAGIMIGLSIFIGLRGFTNTLSKNITKVKDSIVGELAPIRDRVVTIDERTNSLWQYELGKNINLPGTVEVHLTNFAKTTITAQPGVDETSYIIQVEKGTLDHAFILKVAKETRLNNIEIEMFGKLVGQIPLRPNRLKLIVPSTDSELCKKYINIYLKWLDKEYVEALPSVKDFESGIEI